MAIPLWRASRGEANCTSAPSTRSVPSSRWNTPERILISVDFPAPLSPRMHVTARGVDVQRDVPEREDVPEVLRDVLELEQVGRLAHRARSARRRIAVFSSTAARRTTPSKKYTQFESQPEEMIPIWAMPMIAAPQAVPSTEP